MFFTLDYFLPFIPLTAWKMKISKKWKKHLDISLFYKTVPKIMITRYTVPEIWHVTDVIVTFHFGPFFALYPPPQYPSLTCPKNEIFKKMKKTPGDIIILHNCTKNHYHMLYRSWDMVHDRCNCYLSFWTIFCPLNSPKN